MIEDLKRLDFVASIEFSDVQVCSARFLADATESCKRLAPLARFLASAQGLQF
jgi:hypothetical protein